MLITTNEPEVLNYYIVGKTLIYFNQPRVTGLFELLRRKTLL